MCSFFSGFLSESNIYHVVLFVFCLGVFIVISILTIKKYPPYIEKKDKSSDCLIVHAPQIYFRSSISYNAYSFVKRKNGKYKLKPTVLQIIWFILGVVVSFGGYGFVVLIIGTVGSIPFDFSFLFAYLMIFLFFETLFLYWNFSMIVARIYFKKLVKGLM